VQGDNQEPPLSKDEVIAELRGIAKEARAVKDYAPAISAWRLLGAELGMFNGESNNGHEDLNKSSEEIAEEIRRYTDARR